MYGDLNWSKLCVCYAQLCGVEISTISECMQIVEHITESMVCFTYNIFSWACGVYDTLYFRSPKYYTGVSNSMPFENVFSPFTKLRMFFLPNMTYSYIYYWSYFPKEKLLLLFKQNVTIKWKKIAIYYFISTLYSLFQHSVNNI